LSVCFRSMGGYNEDYGGDNGELRHFQEICWSLLDYGNGAMQDLHRFRAAVGSLDAHDLAMSPIGREQDMTKFIEGIVKRITMNDQFLSSLPSPDVCGSLQTREQAMSLFQKPNRHVVQSRNSSKVRSTLRQFVRDWAAEGKSERDVCYAPAMEALRRIMPPVPGQQKPRVLCPGSGLGRLPFDLVCNGYAAQQNEFSYHMILGSHLIFNRTGDHTHVIFPYVLDFENRRNLQDNLKPIRIPDIDLREALPEGAENDFSMASGEFVEVYKDQIDEWDAVITCFFVDTAKNIFLYIRTLADIIRSGGAWVNLGPLLFHYAEMPQETSIELSWEEVRPAISKYFDIVEEKMHDAHYTVNTSSLRKTRYKCILFTAVRNSVPVSGASKAVY